MNDEKNPLIGGGETPKEHQENTAAGVQANVDVPKATPDATPPAEEGETPVGAGETAAAEKQETVAVAGETAAVLPFDFGAPVAAAESRGSKKTFALLFAVFGGVCALLLLLTFALGNAGFKIIRQVNTERTVYVREYDSESGLLTPNEVADLGRKSTVTVLVKKDSGTVIGSGFVYSADGYIITNHHVIEDLYEPENAVIQVVLADGTPLDANLIGSDEDSDIAVLRIAPEKTPAPVVLGSSDALLTGDAVVVIGTPYKLEMAGTATFGSVSAPKRMMPITDASGSIVKKMVLVQTDASINPGNSGGPMFDMYGKVVGVSVMKVTQVNGIAYEGVAFALPIDGVRVVADEIIAKGTFTGKCPYVEGKLLMGITGHGGAKGKWYKLDAGTNLVESFDEEQEGAHYMAESGIYVAEVSGADAKTKVRVGDIILRADGLIMRSTTDLISAVNHHFEGESITLTILRDGEIIEVAIVLAAA